MIDKKKGPPRGRNGGRPKGPTGKAGIPTTLSLSPEAKAILAQQARPGAFVSALIVAASASPARQDRDAGLARIGRAVAVWCAMDECYGLGSTYWEHYQPGQGRPICERVQPTP